MRADRLLSLLAIVKRTGPDRYLARCPAHDDRGPSLSIRQLDDDRVLVHCFAGCSPDEVVGAVGLTLTDLFPERLTPDYTGRPSRERQPFSPFDALLALEYEATLVHLCAEQLALGTPLSDADRARLAVARERIHAALGVTTWKH